MGGSFGEIVCKQLYNITYIVILYHLDELDIIEYT